jgi:transposase
MERKVKYDYAFKLECVELVTNEHCASVSNKRTSESNIRKWVGFLQRIWKVGLLPRKNQSYSSDFKQKVFLSIDEIHYH